jgi:WD40 repeat protein
LVAGHRDGAIRIYSLDAAATPPIEIRVPGPPIDVKSLALTRDGARLAVAWVQGSIWWWDVSKPSESHDLVRHESESDALAFSDDGALLAEEGAQNETTLWSLSPSATEKAKVHNGNWVKRIAFTRDGKWLVRGGSDGLELAEIGGPKRVALDTRSPVEDLALDELGSTLAAVDRDGRLTVWAVR